MPVRPRRRHAPRQQCERKDGSRRAIALVRRLAAGLAGAAIKVASDGLLVHRLRGEPLAARHLALLPVKDLIVAAVRAVAAVRRRVEWRGTVMRIGRGSRLGVTA